MEEKLLEAVAMEGESKSLTLTHEVAEAMLRGALVDAERMLTEQAAAK